MINAEQRTSFLKYNKVAREVKAKKLGYPSAAAYIAFLSGGVLVAPVAIVAVPLKQKKVKAILSVPTIHIVDIADKSGSMDGGKDEATVEGINMGIKELRLNKDNVKYTHTYCDFSTQVNIVHVAVHPDAASDIKKGTRDMTALWDAIGMTVKALEPFVKEGDKVLVNIYTDGQENSSRTFTHGAIKEMIDKYSAKGWTFTFVGTEYDVETIIKRVNIKMGNTRSYDGTAAGMSASMQATNSARANYVAKVVAEEDVSDDFYKNID